MRAVSGRQLLPAECVDPHRVPVRPLLCGGLRGARPVPEHDVPGRPRRLERHGLRPVPHCHVRGRGPKRLRGTGVVVHDLGVDTSEDEFMEAVEEHEAPLMGMSALLTTTMPNMGKTIEAFIDADLRDDVKIMVGGAPVTQEFADDMGADGYGKDAVACVDLAKKLLEERKAEAG